MFLETLSCCYLYLCALQTAKEEEEKSFLCIEAGALHCLRLDPSSRNKKIEKKNFNACTEVDSTRRAGNLGDLKFKVAPFPVCP